MLDQLAYIMRQHDPGYSEHVTHFTEEKVTRLVNRLERGTCCQKVKDLEIVMDDTLLCIYPGMAKDIGDLTLRVDKFEDLMGRLADSGSDLSAACITLEECIEIDREDIVDICKRISNLETSLKSLKEEVNGISITAENGTIYSLKVKREL